MPEVLSQRGSVHCFDVIAVTETFLDDSVHNSHVTPPGYSAFHHDRNHHDGGVMLLVHDCLNAFCRLDPETGCEFVRAELPTRGLSVLFGVVYRPPQSPLSYLEKLCSAMLCAVNCCVLMFICGISTYQTSTGQQLLLHLVQWMHPHSVILYLAVFLHSWLLLPPVKIIF